MDYAIFSDLKISNEWGKLRCESGFLDYVDYALR